MNLSSLLSRFTSQSQKTQCYSKSDQPDCFGTTLREAHVFSWNENDNRKLGKVIFLQTGL